MQFEQRRTVAASRFVPKAAQPVVEIPDEEAPSGADLASEALYRAEAERDLDEEEELFNLEENIVNPTTYNWEDKYRPRKPRYFNRVHTGYEWNKYNQTHYECALFITSANTPLDYILVRTIRPLKLYKDIRFVIRQPHSPLALILPIVQYLLPRSYRQVQGSDVQDR